MINLKVTLAPARENPKQPPIPSFFNYRHYRVKVENVDSGEWLLTYCSQAPIYNQAPKGEEVLRCLLVEVDYFKSMSLQEYRESFLSDVPANGANAKERLEKSIESFKSCLTYLQSVLGDSYQTLTQDVLIGESIADKVCVETALASSL